MGREISGRIARIEMLFEDYVSCVCSPGSLLVGTEFLCRSSSLLERGFANCDLLPNLYFRQPCSDA